MIDRLFVSLFETEKTDQDWSYALMYCLEVWPWNMEGSIDFVVYVPKSLTRANLILDIFK